MNLRNFNKIFRKDVSYGNIKSRNKPEFLPPYKRYIFWKTTGSVKWLMWPNLQVTADLVIFAEETYYEKL